MAFRTRKDRKIALIKQVPLFASLGKAQLGKVASIADEIDLPEGTVLTRQGDRGREFFVLIAGEAEVRRNSRKRATIKSGDFFGEIALVSDRPRTATVTATKPVRMLVITDASFRAVLLRTPEIGLKILAAFAERVPPDANLAIHLTDPASVGAAIRVGRLDHRPGHAYLMSGAFSSLPAPSVRATMTNPCRS
jgi:CRP/FNR family transcriptional regulator, cyclic AMP receptor protein